MSPTIRPSASHWSRQIKPLKLFPRASTKLAGPFGLALAIAAGMLVSFAVRWYAPMGELLPHSETIERARETDGAPRLDNPTTDVTVVLFTDYRCPACRRTDGAILDEIKRDGKIELVVRPLTIFGEQSELAAHAAIAAGLQDRFIEMHRALMTSSAPPNRTTLERLARGFGANDAQLISDLTYRRAEITKLIARNRLAAFALGFRGTPSYLVGRYRIEGALTPRQFRKLVAKAREAR